MKSLRIGFLLPGPPSTPVGGYRVVYSYADRLAQRGHQVWVAHAGKLGQMPTRKPAFPAIARRAWRTWKRWEPRVKPPVISWGCQNPQVKMIYLSNEPNSHVLPESDVVVATAWPTAEYVDQLGSKQGVPFYLIQHVETWHGSAQRALATWDLPLYKIMVSQWLLEQYGNIGTDTARHIANGLDSIFLQQPDAGHRPLSIVTPYHSMPWKGTQDALDALKIIHERHPTIPMQGFGTAPAPDDWPSWIGRDNYVENPAQAVLARDIYGGHSIFVGASWHEGFGLMGLEAMACGAVFVGTDSGGCRDYAVDGVNSLLSAPRDVEGLVDQLERVIRDKELRECLRTAGQLRARQFTWERATTALEEYFAYGLQKGPLIDRVKTGGFHG